MHLDGRRRRRPVAPAMSGIFISYRRDDTAPYARLLSDALAARFGRERIYRDLDSMGPGVDFPEAIAEAVATCDVFLALIGPRWLLHRPDGSLRLADPADYVRIEIAAALAREVLVVPVLVEGTVMPSRAELPEPVAELADRNAHRLSDEGWNEGVERLVRSLETVVGADRPRVRRRMTWRQLRTSVVALAVIAVVVAAVLLVRAWTADDPASGGRPRPILCAFGEVTIAVRPGARLERTVTFVVSIKTGTPGVSVPGFPYVSVLTGDDTPLPTEFSSWPSSPTALVPGTPFEGTVAVSPAGGRLPERGSAVRVRVDQVTGEGPACSLPSYDVTVP